MLIAADTGAELDLSPLVEANGGRLDRALFGEAASRVIVAVASGQRGQVQRLLDERGLEHVSLGRCGGSVLRVAGLPEVSVESMSAAWRTGLVLN